MPVLFCNVCSLASNKENINFFLTCGHILCKSCLKLNESRTAAKCSVCGKTSGFRELDKLPDNLKNTFFTENLDKVFDESLKVVQFQQQQEQNAFLKIKNYRSKYGKLQKNLNKEMALIKHLEANIAKYQKRREQMQSKLAEIYKRENEKSAKTPTQQYREQFSIDSSTSSPVARSNSNDDSNSFNFTPSIHQEYFSNNASASKLNKSRRKSIPECVLKPRSPFFI